MLFLLFISLIDILFRAEKSQHGAVGHPVAVFKIIDC
jgi:hypothetical protein